MDDDVIFRREGELGRITLNRPKALNALNLEMCSSMLRQLHEWALDPAVRAVVIDAVPGRAFCAGGDLKDIYDWGRAKDERAARYFTTEYRLNAAIRHFEKPYIALIDGLTMGGGAGVSIHGSFRVVSENTVFAMPETSIGLFPDIGASYFLSHLPGEIGMYLALTGLRITPADMLYTGLATHFVPAGEHPEILRRLSRTESAADILDRLAAGAGATPLANLREAIDRAFAKDSVTAILAALSNEGDWGLKTADLLRTRSPTSLELTFREIRRGAQLEFNECMRMEYRLTTRILSDHDFYEGVRAAIIDKDQTPRWQPNRLDAVNAETIEKHFDPLGNEELSL
ncbi:MAG TPA: enoyl-CoA hydratase/isomerase family protein [Micropepsaceae bacterium]|nr:enoyl-CoA hydratase/isomerase family protein [Micropepsaceae bacterium]